MTYIDRDAEYEIISVGDDVNRGVVHKFNAYTFLDNKEDKKFWNFLCTSDNISRVIKSDVERNLKVMSAVDFSTSFCYVLFELTCRIAQKDQYLVREVFNIIKQNYDILYHLKSDDTGGIALVEVDDETYKQIIMTATTEILKRYMTNFVDALNRE